MGVPRTKAFECVRVMLASRVNKRPTSKEVSFNSTEVESETLKVPDS
jgi:hypothetical protein